MSIRHLTAQWLSGPQQRVMLSTALLGFMVSPLVMSAMQSSMWLHMAVQLPGFAWIGWWCAGAIPEATLNRWRMVNHEGVPCWLIWIAITTVWMVPRSLDLALQSPTVNFVKIMSCLTAGTALSIAWRQSGLLVRVFAAGNWAWMSWVAGALYLEAPNRLCNAYLQDDQQWAGTGLLLWGFLAAASLMLSRGMAVKAYGAQQPKVHG